MVGVGLEELGLEEFVEGKFFDGELYIDMKKKCYQDFGFKRLGFFSAIGSVIKKKGRDMIAEATGKGISGNMKGDGMQNGGTIVVAAGGKVLLTYMQESPADHVAPEDVLKALGIEVPAEAAEESTAAKVVCDEEACSIQKTAPKVICDEEACSIQK